MSLGNLQSGGSCFDLVLVLVPELLFVRSPVVQLPCGVPRDGVGGSGMGGGVAEQEAL